VRHAGELSAYRSSSTGAIVYHDRLPPAFRETLTNGACNNIYASA
jgi:hypothetical protein